MDNSPVYLDMVAEHMNEQIGSDAAIMVSIHCLVYNHEPFIRQCLEGFVMQKTNFPFEAIVHEDASTDGSAAIIREYAEKYPDIIKPIFETENQYSKHDDSIARVMHVHMRGKYIAWCEGDDYWIDPLKLQKQVDFLESHPDYGMCYTNFNLYKQEQNKMFFNVFDSFPEQFPNEYSLSDFILRTGFMCPPSWLYRKELYNSFKPGIRSLDVSFLLFAHFLYETKLHYIHDVTAVYRYHDGSVSHVKDYKSQYKRRKSILESQIYLIDTYKLDLSLKDCCLHSFYHSNLPLFIIHQQWDEYEKAKSILVNPTMAEKCCFFSGKTVLGRLSISFFYNIFIHVKKFYRHFRTTRNI